MKKFDLELENNLVIEVGYDWEPGQKESWGYNGGDPHIPAHIEAVYVLEITQGSVNDLAEYINDLENDFFEHLEIKAYEYLDR